MGAFRWLSSFIAILSGSVSPSSSTITGAFMLICSARVPSTLALSNRVMYGVVIRSAGGTASPLPPPSGASISTIPSSRPSPATHEPGTLRGAAAEDPRASGLLTVDESVTVLLLALALHVLLLHDLVLSLKIAAGGAARTR